MATLETPQVSRPPIRVSVLHAGGEPGYLFGLVSGLRKIEDLEIEVVDSDKTLGMFQGWPNVSHYNLRGDQDHSSRLTRKIARVSEYYVRLLVYVSTTKASVLHIQWENKFLLFDRTLLLLYYKLLGKRLVLTAHNVNEAAREGKENMTSHFSLWARYRIVDHIIVHSEQMKRELARDFSVRENKIAVIPHGINNMVRRRGITREEARTALQISMETKLLLFFGNIDRYKGVDLALNALKILIDKDPSFQIAIVGRHKDCSDYVNELQSLIDEMKLTPYVTMRLQFIPDNEIEVYFQAADCLLLPYRRVSQSGVPFLSFQFGLPIVATRVGSLREVVIEGENGFTCEPGDPTQIAEKISQYFESPLYFKLAETRVNIRKRAERVYSWDAIGAKTCQVYNHVLGYVN